MTTLRVILLALPVEVGVRTMPLPLLVRLLGFTLATGGGDVRPEPATALFDPVERRRIHAVLRVMRHWPFGQGACLRQALLLGHMLRARQPVLHLGVAGRGHDITAHAWIQVSGVTLGGVDGFLPLVGPKDGGR